MEQLTLEPSPTYLVYYDPEKKKPVRRKIEAACGIFITKRDGLPTHVLCHAEDAKQAGEIPGLTIEARHYIARHTFYVGGEE